MAAGDLRLRRRRAGWKRPWRGAAGAGRAGGAVVGQARSAGRRRRGRSRAPGIRAARRGGGRAKSTRTWLKERPQVRLVPLPVYAPELNRREHIWRWLRAAVTHHHFFGSFAALLAATHRFSATMAQDRAAVLRRIGRSLRPWHRHFATIA